MAGYVVRRVAGGCPPPPESGVRLIAIDEHVDPRGWRDLHTDVLQEFRKFGRVDTGDRMTNAKDEFRRCT